MKVFLLCLMAVMLAGCVGGPTMKQTQEREKSSAKLHTELAGLYFQRNQMGIALSETELAMKASPNYAPAYNVRGLIHMALHEDKEAEGDFKQSLRIDDADSETQNNFGWFLCQRGRAQESIAHFMAAVKDPLYTTPELAYLNAGLCSQKAGKNQDAEDFLQRALHIQPEMGQALLAMAELKFAAGDFQGAQKYFARFDNDNMTAEQLWLGVRIEHAVGDKSLEARYSSRLRGRFPDAHETQLLMHGE